MSPKSLKVLIVEDSREDAELLVQELRHAGFDPDWQRVDTEVEYLDRLQGGINLVLSNYQMPQFSGLRALELLKQGGLDVPFILVSGVTGEDTAVSAMKQGATDYLIKNRLANFGQSVSQALEATRIRAERRRVEQRLLLQCTALEAAANAIVITDVAGTILWVNPAFTTQSGYTADEAIGQTPRLLKSGQHDLEFYQKLWATVLSGKKWRGVFTNQHKDGTFYIDEQTITPVRAKEGAVTHFVTIMDDVTERLTADAALKSAHTQLRTLLDHSPAVLYSLKAKEGKVTSRFFSANVTRLLGFEVAETEDLGWLAANLHPDDRSRALAGVAEALSRGGSNSEYRLQHKDGTYRWLEDHLRLVRNVPGELAELAGVWTDITESKQAQKALAESENRLLEMLENVNLIAFTLDKTGLVTFCNNHLLQITGWERNEVIGTDWFEKFLPASDTETKKLFFNTVDAGLFPAHRENAIKTRMGETREIAWNNTPLRDQAGKPVGTASIGEDITDRRKTAFALRASEERFRQVVENILEVFWMTDVKTNTILYVSPGYEAIWGRTCDSLYASAKGWLENIHEHDRSRIEQAAITKQLLGTYDETYRIVRPDGTLRWVRSRAFPVRNGTDEVSRIVGVAEDVTEKKKMEEQVLRGQRLECIGMLASGIAHDLNNVLAPICMAVPMLRTNATGSGDQHMLDILERCGERGAGLVRQILGFVHGIGGEPRVTQVSHLLGDIADVVAETFPKSVMLSKEISGDLWPILANPTQIHQVVLNLCVNARDAMPQGGTLTLRAENILLNDVAAQAIEGGSPGMWLVIVVEDTGTGIPPEVLLHIWEPFFTTKSADHGTGLGLSTVRGIVEAHRGFLTIDTRVGRGTRFRVFLPADSSAIANKAAVNPWPSARGNNELILLVDDEEPIRDAACAILVKAGYRVLTAGEGLAALKIVEGRAAEIALVITDRDMPLGGGIALAKAIYNRGFPMKTLLISGLSSEEYQHTDQEQVADAFIAKPFTGEKLLSAVQDLLANSHHAAGVSNSSTGSQSPMTSRL